MANIKITNKELTLQDIRNFVEATKDLPGNTWVQSGNNRVCTRLYYSDGSYYGSASYIQIDDKFAV